MFDLRLVPSAKIVLLGAFLCSACKSVEPVSLDRVVAIGDLHGDLDAARAALRLSGATDSRDRWVGGKLVLVQTGDILDRGDGEEAILDLFQRLATEARSAGGEVHLLNGNHELMNVDLDFRYVTEAGFRDFEGMVPDAPSDSLLDLLPEHERPRAALFRPGGPMARNFADRPLALSIGENLFVHGGILPEHVEMGLEAMNQATSAWLAGRGPRPEWLSGERSPVWTRLYSDQPGPAACDTLRQVLDRLEVERMIVGHTVQGTGITAYCGGLVWGIDVGMAAYYGGRPEILEIRGDRVRSLW
jgi:hypothetical protein